MSSNRTIAKNTIFLYFRMILLLVIGLYTSRVVLQTLGVSDYGLYSVVGGVVAMMGFMHSTLSGATTRFLNVEMAQGTEESKRKIFSTSVFIHLGLCVVLLILGETAGLWFVMHKLNIPEGRYVAAMVVYQISILAVLFTVMQIPYDAAIIAHEKMNIYAYLSLFDAAGKLMIVFLIQVLPWDRLIMYALLTLLISIISRIAAQIYCRRKFSETTFTYCFDKKMFQEIMGFFGWDLFGNFALMTKNEGNNILQNLFFGTVVNAAVGLATMVNQTITNFVSNFTLSFKPQIIQSYIKGDLNRTFFLMNNGIRYSFFLILLIIVPVFLETDFFLSLWLHSVPTYVPGFVKLLLIVSVISVQNPLMLYVIQATGKIKMMSIINAMLFIISFPVCYIFFKNGYSPYYQYYINIFIFIGIAISTVFVLKMNVGQFSILDFIKNVLSRNLAILMVSAGLVFIFRYYISANSLAIIIASEIIVLSSVLLIGISASERKWLLAQIQTKILKK